MKKVETQTIDLGAIGNEQFFYLKDDYNWHFKINSVGGSMSTTSVLGYRMSKHKHKVTTENVGNCQSAGFFLFLMGSERISTEFGVFLFHSGSWSGQTDLNSLKSYLNKYQNHVEFFLRRLAKISNKSYKYWKDLHESDKDCFFTAKELYKMGIVTKII